MRRAAGGRRNPDRHGRAVRAMRPWPAADAPATRPPQGFDPASRMRRTTAATMSATAVRIGWHRRDSAHSTATIVRFQRGAQA